MAKYRNKSTSEIVDAIQFDPKQQWPAKVISWNEVGYRPRDGSWGYIQTKNGKEHVMAGDWIVTDIFKDRSLFKDTDFKATYEPAGDIVTSGFAIVGEPGPESYTVPEGSTISPSVDVTHSDGTKITYQMETKLSEKQMQDLEDRIVERVLEELHKPDPRAKYD